MVLQDSLIFVNKAGVYLSGLVEHFTMPRYICRLQTYLATIRLVLTRSGGKHTCFFASASVTKTKKFLKHWHQVENDAFWGVLELRHAGEMNVDVETWNDEVIGHFVNYYSKKSVWLALQILYFSFKLFTSRIDNFWPQSTILSFF